MFKEPFSFEGRIRRTEFVITIIISIVVIGLLQFLTELISFIDLLYIPFYWFVLAQGTKRCHDLNHEGWYQIIPFYFFALIFSKGDIENNIYGRNPKIND
jgi:uncharacterized membrane protein YhaH (DUF805 family)